MSDLFADILKEFDNLSDLLDVREATHTGLTQAIMKPYENVLTNVVRIVSGHDNPVYWQSVEKIKNLPEFVTVGGYSTPSIGALVHATTGEVTITNENVKRYRSEVRMVVPIKLLQSGTEVQLISFVKQFAAISAVTSGEELMSILRQYLKYEHEELYSKEHYMQLLDNATRPADIEGFDTSHLTDDQMTRIRLYSSAQTETKH